MFLLALLGLPPTANAADVLVLYDTDAGSTPALVAAIEARGHKVTLSEVREDLWNGTNPPLDDFAAVVHLNGTTFDDTMSSAATESLRDFVRLQGRGYVAFEWHAYAQSAGYEPGLRDLTLLDRTSVRDATITVTATEVDHPVFEGVTFPVSFEGTVNVGSLHAFSTDAALRIARDDMGSPFAAVREFGAGRVVHFSHTGNWDEENQFDNADLARMAANAVTWAADCDRDADGLDRIGVCGGEDCNDDDARIGEAATWYTDADADGFGDDTDRVLSCVQPPDAISVAGDCDDDDPDVNPDAEEIAYDGIDNDCAGGDQCDVDGDGFAADACGGDDCDDTDASVNPDADEIRGDDIDNDCDGDVDGGCGCSAGTGPRGAIAGLGLVALALLRRRKSGSSGATTSTSGSSSRP